METMQIQYRQIASVSWFGVALHGTELVNTLLAVEGNINADRYQQFVASDSSTLYIFQDGNVQVQPNILSLEIDSQQLVSSDINIIETSGCNIKIKLHGRIGRVENKNDLFREILIIWTAITPQYVL